MQFIPLLLIQLTAYMYFKPRHCVWVLKNVESSLYREGSTFSCLIRSLHICSQGILIVLLNMWSLSYIYRVPHFLRKQVKYYFSIKIGKEIKPRHFVVFLENVEPSLYREDSTFLENHLQYLSSFTAILAL